MKTQTQFLNVFKVLLMVGTLGLSSFAHGKTIVEIAAGNKNFSTLVSLVKEAGLVDALNGDGPLTVFAPTNDAFAKLPASLVEKLKSDKQLLTKVLTYHVAAGNFSTTSLSKIKKLDTLSKLPIRIRTKGKRIFLNNSKTQIVLANVKASNGVIQAINTVLMPSDASRAERYRIVAKPSIAEVVSKNANFSTLAIALGKAGLVELFDGKKPFTVFAPTNAAFAKLPKATLEAVLADRALLTKILTYHVVAGSNPACRLLKKRNVQTVEGQNVRVSYRKGEIFVNSSKVVSSDIETKRGIIQVIDTVLMPK